MALGNQQVYGINCEETFDIAAAQSWTLFQMDVKNAFLHGNLKEQVCMKLPLGVPGS